MTETSLEKCLLRDLKPYANNPRNIQKAVPDVKESIKQCGYITPIIIDENNVILAGHTRFRALSELGETEAEVIVAHGMDEETGKKYRLFDNKTNEFAGWSAKLLREELSGVDFQGYDFGQPVIKLAEPKSRNNKAEVKTKTCPCCGKVFEI